MAERELKIMIAAGGTGGHVFPGIAIAEAIRDTSSETKVVFAGTRDGPEAKLVPEAGWELAYVGSHSTHAGGTFNRVLSYLRVPGMIFKALCLLSKEKPAAVIGTGGFAVGPLVLAAALKGIPTAIVEPNAVAGRANKKLARFVNKIFVGFSTAARAFPSQKVVVTGVPVRESILKARHERRFDRPLTILCYGGSQGAQALNEVMVAMTPHIEKLGDRIRIIHQVGKIEAVEKAADMYKRAQLEAEVFPFSNRIADLYCEADLAVARAGAGTVAELAAAGIPSILVPLPHAVDDHQRANAQQIANDGGAIVVEQDVLTGEALAKIVMDFMENPTKLQAMCDALAKTARPDAADHIAKEIFLLARGTFN
jgi:UDP-N-acetylglucosamine--N-acetylmuramyl-(pentapeptide) pyrophosphoryl-undecaprenol N-acetylglucosamine transferase